MTRRPLTGKIFGRLTVTDITIRKRIRNKYRILWWCGCECGNTVWLDRTTLKDGNTKSCGCLRKELSSIRSLKHGQNTTNITTSEYVTWQNIKSRCYNSKNTSYKRYGGRGIKVCDRWLNSFENFFEDMGKKPSINHSIERIDYNKDYEPTNCKWGTTFEQVRNVSTNRWIEYKGQKLILEDWCRKLRTHSSNIRRAIKNWGVGIEEIFQYYENKNGLL